MEPGMTKRGPGWDIGGRPLVPMPYIKLPEYKYVQTDQRDKAFDQRENFASMQIARGLRHCRERHARQRRDGAGWKSKLHKELDYRTVDELGLRPEHLILDRKPKLIPEKLIVVEDLLRRRGGQEGNLQHQDLTPGHTESGHVLEGEFRYYRINVPRMTALEIRLVTARGDPDMYVCNRFPNPHQTQREPRAAVQTWRARTHARFGPKATIKPSYASQSPSQGPHTRPAPTRPAASPAYARAAALDPPRAPVARAQTRGRARASAMTSSTSSQTTRSSTPDVRGVVTPSPLTAPTTRRAAPTPRAAPAPRGVRQTFTLASSGPRRAYTI
eukprot:5565064-Prymnesium_polylepis.1